MKRRTFLKNGLLLTGAAYASQFMLPQRVFASGMARPQFFLQITISGGWHTSLSVDPWIKAARPSEKDAFIEYRADEILKEGNLFLGPAMQSMRSFAPQMNIINGIYMSSTDSGHIANEVYMHSGSGTGHYGALVVEHELVDQEYPLGVLTNALVYSGGSAVTSSQVAILENLSPAADTSSPFDNPDSPVVKAQKVLTENAQKITDFNQARKNLQSQGIALTYSHSIALAYRYGLAANAYLSLATGNLDTHASHEYAHKEVQTQSWDQVAELLNAFKQVEWESGVSMYDLTTFYITSEFSRTPALNAAKGTDHNPLNNSAVIIGPGFKGNTTFGASRLVTGAESANGASYLIANMVNLQSGEIITNKDDAKAKGHLIKPETIIATLAEGLGIQRNIFPVVNQQEQAIRKILKI